MSLDLSGGQGPFFEIKRLEARASRPRGTRGPRVGKQAWSFSAEDTARYWRIQLSSLKRRGYCARTISFRAAPPEIALCGVHTGPSCSRIADRTVILHSIAHAFVHLDSLRLEKQLRFFFFPSFFFFFLFPHERRKLYWYIYHFAISSPTVKFSRNLVFKYRKIFLRVCTVSFFFESCGAKRTIVNIFFLWNKLEQSAVGLLNKFAVLNEVSYSILCPFIRKKMQLLANQMLHEWKITVSVRQSQWISIVWIIHSAIRSDKLIATVFLKSLPVTPSNHSH